MKKRLKFKRRYLFFALFIALGLGINNEEKNSSGSGVIEKVLMQLVMAQVSGNIMPISEFAGQGEENGQDLLVENFFFEEFPIMVQAMPVSQGEVQIDDVEPETESGGDNLYGEEILAGMLAENGNTKNTEEVEMTEEAETTEETVVVGQEVVSEGDTEFRKAVKTNSFDFDALTEYQTLVSTFYTIDAGTTAGSNELNLEKFLSKDMTISKEDPGPQILIYHTHSLETFIDSEPGNRSQTIVGVGDRLAEILTEEYGYSVLHHTEEYDTTRDDAYANSLPGITKVLEENPSIQVVIDLHRDAGVEGVHRAIELDGKSTATFMLFNGLSRTRKTGDIDYLYNPYLADNLAFSFQMQLKAGEYYPGLTRKIYLKAYRYNMHLIPKTLLIELGDSNNTVEEAMNTCDPLAHILDMVLSGEG